MTKTNFAFIETTMWYIKQLLKFRVLDILSAYIIYLILLLSLYLHGICIASNQPDVVSARSKKFSTLKRDFLLLTF